MEDRIDNTDVDATDPTPAKPSRLASLMSLLARGIAMFFGLFGLLNVAGAEMSDGFDINVWWVDMRWMPALVANGLIVLACGAMVVFAVAPRMRAWRRVATRVSVGWLLAVALANTWMFFVLRWQGSFRGGLSVPLSLVVAGLLGWLWLALRPRPADVVVPMHRDAADHGTPRTGRMRRAIAVLFVTGVLALAFPLAQMAFFGRTSYARRVDAIVVFGARTYANGRMSVPLADRVRTACALYRDGLAEWMIVSGGPGDGDIHETEAMRLAAIDWGVPAERIICDNQGLNTDATVANTVRVFRQRGIRRVLTVSHWYHLPRIKMTYQRAGRHIYTTPAKESYTLTAMPYYLLREIAAVWAYYLRPLRML